MNNRVCLPALLLSLAVPLVAPITPLAAQANLLASPNRWTVSEDGGWFGVEDGESVLHLTGGSAGLNGFEFTDGDISFEMKLTSYAAFVGILFRDGERDAEHVYFRPHRSGEWDAVQYQPIMNGSSTWQLYSGEGFTAPAWLEPGAWVPVRIEVRNSWATLFVGDVAEPTMSITLERGVTSGGISFSGGFRDDVPDGEVAGSFRRLTVDPAAAMASADGMSSGEGSNSDTPDDNFLRQWSVSAPFAVSELPVTTVPRTMGEWTDVWADSRGLVNLSSHFSRISGAFRSAVAADVTIDSRNAVRVPLDFDFSDEVSVFLNDTLLYSGTNSWNSRYPYYLGALAPETLSNRVGLNLRQGENHLTFVVSEAAFGWGFLARMDRPGGVAISGAR